MTKLVGIDHSADRLHHAIGHLKLEHGEHPPLGVVPDRARLAVDPGQPEGSAQGPAPAGEAGQQPGDPLRPMQRIILRLPSRHRAAAVSDVMSISREACQGGQQALADHDRRQRDDCPALHAQPGYRFV